MLKGFIDVWGPIRERISRFWKSDFETIKSLIDELSDEIDFNNFTFDSKWVTNGIKSDLPFLYNHPESSNVRTSNEWGKQIIEYLHSKDITVGFNIPALTYRKSYWGENAVLGITDKEHEWLPGEHEMVIADFSNKLFIEREKELIKEQLSVFPNIDHLFFEFEGLGKYFDTLDGFKRMYTSWAKKNNKPDIDNVTYSEEVLYYPRLHNPSAWQEDALLWSNEGLEMLRHYFKINLNEINNLLTELKFKGDVGVVFLLTGYEALIYPEILPHKNWWLVPWHYWNWDRKYSPGGSLADKKSAAVEMLKRWKKNNAKICYIGDVALGMEDLDSIEEFYNYCVEMNFEGYLGMGVPNLEIGKNGFSDKITEGQIIRTKALYRKLYSDFPA